MEWIFKKSKIQYMLENISKTHMVDSENRNMFT